MNVVEFDQAFDAAVERLHAMSQGAAGPLDRNAIVSVFAGTDLPGHDVLQMLAEQVNAALLRVDEIGVSGVMQGIALNTFIIGFECGRRSK